MKQDSFANRLQKAMDLNNYKQIDLVNKTKLDKSLINKYLNGVSEAGNDKIEILSKALNVSEVWLMGYDVPISDGKPLDQFELLWKKYKDKLTQDDKDYMEFVLRKKIKEIDKQLGEDE